MMISPQAYAENLKDLPYEELIDERNSLIQALHRFENGNISNEEKNINPSPEVVYQCNNEYLVEVTKLLNGKFNQRLWCNK